MYCFFDLRKSLEKSFVLIQVISTIGQLHVERSLSNVLQVTNNFVTTKHLCLLLYLLLFPYKAPSQVI